MKIAAVRYEICGIAWWEFEYDTATNLKTDLNPEWPEFGDTDKEAVHVRLDDEREFDLRDPAGVKAFEEAVGQKVYDALDEFDHKADDADWTPADVTPERKLLDAAKTFIDRFVPVEDALVNGFDVGEWCKQVEALTP